MRPDDGGDAFFLTWRGGRNGSAEIYGWLFRYLQAGFSGAPSSGTASLEVQFTDESTPADRRHLQRRYRRQLRVRL